MSTESAGGAVPVDPSFLEAFTARWTQAWEERDVEAIAAMCGEDITVDDPALPEPLRGKDGIRSFARDTFATFPDLRIEPLEAPVLSSLGDGAWFPYRMSGTMRGHWAPLDIAPTGGWVDFRGVTEWRFRDGLLVLWDTIYDNLAVARQMGLVSPHGSRGDRLFTRLQHLQARGQRRRAEKSDPTNPGGTR